MSEILNWIKENQILSGLGVFVVGAAGAFFKKIFGKSSDSGQPYVSIINSTPSTLSSQLQPTPETPRQRAGRELVRILFVDDDTKFRVVNILKNAGWRNVKITKDIKDLEAPEVLDAQIFFVDIQGVGKALGFSDEGLGLSLALKHKYPEKKVVIYSAQTDGDRFHRALNKADGSLSKNAEPYQFIALVEELMGY